MWKAPSDRFRISGQKDKRRVLIEIEYAPSFHSLAGTIIARSPFSHVAGVKWVVSSKNTRSPTVWKHWTWGSYSSLGLNLQRSLKWTLLSLTNSTWGHPNKEGESRPQNARVSVSRSRANPEFLFNPFIPPSRGKACIAQFLSTGSAFAQCTTVSLLCVLCCGVLAHGNREWTSFDWASLAEKKWGAFKKKKGREKQKKTAFLPDIVHWLSLCSSG